VSTLRSLFVLALLLSPARPVWADWSLGAFLGGSWTSDASLDVAQPASGTDITFSSVHYAGEAFKSPPYYGYRVAFFPESGWFGIEGELIHLKVIADTARTTPVDGTLGGTPVSGAVVLSSVLQRFSITHGVNLLLVNALFRHASDSSRGTWPRWTFVGRAGAGASIPHPESTIGGLTFEHYEWGAFSVQGAAAIEVSIAGPVFLSGEYKLTRTVQDVTIVGGSARTPLLTQHLTAGVLVRLGSPPTSQSRPARRASPDR